MNSENQNSLLPQEENSSPYQILPENENRKTEEKLENEEKAPNFHENEQIEQNHEPSNANLYRPEAEDLEEPDLSKTLLGKCRILPQTKVQPYLFHNSLFNPQFDVFNPIFGLRAKDSISTEVEDSTCEEEKEGTGGTKEEKEKKKKKDEKNKDLEMARLFTTLKNLTSADEEGSLPRIMPHVPLKKSDEFLLNEKPFDDPGNNQKNVDRTVNMYKEIMILLIKIIVVVFLIDVLPPFAAAPSLADPYLTDGSNDFGSTQFNITQQLVQFICDVITFIVLVCVIRNTRNILQERFLLNLDPEFMFGVIFSDLPESTTMYDLIVISRKIMGPNYGIVDIVMVNDYSHLENAQNYVKEKEMLYWSWEHYQVFRDKSMTEENMKNLEEIRKAKILEEKKMIKLGNRFTGAALVIFQTQENSERILQKLSPFNLFMFYTRNKIALIHGHKISVEYLTEPRDLLWENLGINRLQRRGRAFLIFIIIILVLIFLVQPLIGNNPIGPGTIYPQNEYILTYVFPFIGVIFCFIIETPLMFVGGILRFSSYSQELIQLISFSFPLFLGTFISIAYAAMSFGRDGYFNEWHINFTIGCFLAIVLTTPFKRIWNKNFLTYGWGKMKYNYKRNNGQYFSRLEYEKANENPHFDWIAPLHSIMSILSFLFVTKEISFYSCFFAILMVVIVWKVDQFFINNMTIKVPTVMVIKAMFNIMDLMLLMMAFSNGIVNILGAIAFGEGFSIFGIIWIMFAFMWIYAELAWNTRIACFDFKLTKSNKRLLESTKLQFVPEKQRKNVINIDRNLEFTNFTHEEVDQD